MPQCSLALGCLCLPGPVQDLERLSLEFNHVATLVDAVDTTRHDALVSAASSFNFLNEFKF